MIAEVHDAERFLEHLTVPAALLPEHVYCETCGDCLICEPHDEEAWCATGGRWVLYTDMEEDAALIASVRSASPLPVSDQQPSTPEG
jgi:hypothetical protein